MHEVLMPRIDVAMQSGKVLEWLKKEGDEVHKGEPVVRIEGEKTTFDVEAPSSGILKSIIAKAGLEVPVATILGVIGEPGEEVPAGYAAATVALVPEPIQAEGPVRLPSQRALVREVRASPAARALARKHGVDLSKVQGTGPDGRVQSDDVLRAVEQAKAPVPEKLGTVPRVKETIALKGIRKSVAERLTYSFHSTVPVLLTVDVNMDALQEARSRMDEAVSVTAFVVKAVAKALRENLILNSSFEEGKVKIYDDINISVAMNTSEGLTAPTIAGAEKLSLSEISEKIGLLRERSAAGSLTIDEVTGGTFTVTNLGAEGVGIFAPIINPPQAAILAVGQSTKRPVVEGDSVKIRTQATLSLIFDHRITDGVPAAQFLVHVKRLLEDTSSLIG